MKELSYFVEWYHRLPEEILLKWVVSIIDLGAVSLVSNAAEWKRMFGSIQDLQCTMKRSQMDDT